MTTLDWPVVRVLGKQRYLFGSLVLLLLVGPLTGSADRPGPNLVMYAVLTLVVITGPLAVSRSRASLAFTFALALLMLVPGLFSTVVDVVTFWIFSTALGVVFFSFLTVLIIRDLLFVSASVDSETLWAAVNVYLLVGIVFAFTYSAIALADPTTFVGKFMDSPLQDQIYGFIYFSFITLTTLGYGDLTPNNTVVGTLTYIEALIGQLYVAIMIARLVALYVARKE